MVISTRCIVLLYGVMVPVLGTTSTKLTQVFPFLKHVRAPLGSIKNCSSSMETVLMSLFNCTASVLYHRKVVGEIIVASSAGLFLVLFLNQNQSVKAILKESRKVTQIESVDISIEKNFFPGISVTPFLPAISNKHCHTSQTPGGSPYSPFKFQAAQTNIFLRQTQLLSSKTVLDSSPGQTHASGKPLCRRTKAVTAILIQSCS